MSSIGIYKRKDRRYEGRVYLGKNKNGKRIYRSFYGYDKDEVRRKYHDFEKGTDVICTVTEMTVKELILDWLNVMSLRVRESTLANYRMKAEKHVIPSFGEFDCGSLKGKDIYNFL